MKAHDCCEAAPTGNGREIAAGRDYNPGRPRFTPRCFDLVRWLVPAAVLALLPKCPMCLAAYIAFGTGIGLSVAAAAHLRILLVILCVTSLCYLGVRRLKQ